MSSEWQAVQLGDFVEIRHGWPFKSEFFDTSTHGGHLPIVVAIGNFEYSGGFRFGSTQIKRYRGEFPQDYRLNAGDILLVMTCQTPGGEILGIPARIPNDEQIYLHNQRLGRVVRKSPQVSLEYLYWLFLHPEFNRHLVGSATGTKILHTAPTRIESFKFDLPPLDEQERIASVLFAIDDHINLLSETNATLEAIAKALFKSWFVNFDPVRSKSEGLEPEGITSATSELFPDSFEESELGLVPSGWQVRSVGDSMIVTDFVANGSFAALKENVSLQDTPAYAIYVRTTDYNSGFSGGYKYVNKSAYDFLRKSSLDGSEVVISNVGDVGTVFRPPSWIGMPMTLGSNAVALKSPQMSCFLYFYFSGKKGQHDLQSIVTGSAQLKFNKTNFRSLRLVIPERSILDRFEKIAGTFFEKIDKNRAKAQTLIKLRDTLLPRLISGQLRLPKTEASIENMLSEPV